MSAPWHDDPALAGRFHPEHLDDLQVLVHDGEPRRTKRELEACWVAVKGVRGVLRMPISSPEAEPPVPPDAVEFVERPVYEGLLLNKPHNLTTVRQGDMLLFVTSPGIPHPLRVIEQYVHERESWSILPCDRCGADQTLDPPTIMHRTRFPNSPPESTPVAFSAFCPCGGVMALAIVGESDEEDEGDEPEEPDFVESLRDPRLSSSRKPWWKFW